MGLGDLICFKFKVNWYYNTKGNRLTMQKSQTDRKVMLKAHKRLHFRLPEQKLKILKSLLFSNVYREIRRSLGNPTLASTQTLLLLLWRAIAEASII